MKFYIKKESLQSAEQLDVVNNSGMRIYFFKKIKNTKNSFKMYDHFFSEILVLSKRKLSFLPTFSIRKKNDTCIEVRRKLNQCGFTFVRMNWEITVNKDEHNYSIFNYGSRIASVKEISTSLENYYEIDVNPLEDEAIAIASIVAINCLMKK